MKYKLAALFLLACMTATSCNLIKGKKLEDAKFTAKGISVSTVAVGETTSIFGTGFGEEKGKVFIGETEVPVISWTNKVVRIRIPRVEKANYDVNIQPPGSKTKFAQKIGVREPVDEGLYDWLDTNVNQVDSSTMEPLVLVFKPVGPPTSGIMDFDSAIAKSKAEYIDEIEWACSQGVQAVQLYFPSQTPPDAENYADVSMQNIRYIVQEVANRCPGVLIDIDDTYMPDGNVRLARLLPKITTETIFNIGSFEPDPEKDLRLEGITDPQKAKAEISDSLRFYKHPIPYVMTTWQAFDLNNFAQRGVLFPEPRSAIISLALDQRAQDGRKAYDDIRNLLPAGTSAIGATNLLHVSEIMGHAITSGDHLAFGLDYSTFWPGSSQARIPNNMFLLEKALQVAETIKRPLASREEAAAILGVVPIPPVTEAPIRIKNYISDRPRRTYKKSSRGRIAVLDSLPANSVADTASSYDSRELWVLANKSVYMSDDGGETYENVPIKSRRSFAPTSIATTADGSIWAASPGEGIFRSADYGRHWDQYNVDSGSLLSGYAASLYSYGNEIYSCTYKNDKDSPITGTGIAFTTDNGKEWSVWTAKNGLPYDDCRTVYVEDMAVFVGFGGLSEDSEAFGLGVSNDFGETWTLTPGIEVPVLSIAAWHDNTLIVGTKGGGAFSVLYNGRKATRITDVPETATVTDIVIDGRGWVWLATDAGIMVSDSNMGPYRTFTTGDGVASTRVTGGAYAGKVFFATVPDDEFVGGLTSFYLEAAPVEEAATETE